MNSARESRSSPSGPTSPPEHTGPQALSDPSDPAIESAADLWRRLRALVLDDDRRREVCAALDLSFLRVKALRRLARGPATMGELAADLLTDAAYVTAMVDALVDRGFVQRRPHPGDRRVRLAVVTVAGAAAAARADAILDRPPPTLAELDAPDLAELKRLLDRITDHGDDAAIPRGLADSRAFDERATGQLHR